MNDIVPPTRAALREALGLSEEILRNIEMSEIPLARVALKAGRLAHLLNDFDHQRAMEYEVAGYPSTPNGVPADAYRLAVLAGREFERKDEKSGAISRYIYNVSIEELEQEESTAQAALAAARDPDVSVSSANPNQFVFNPTGNFMERNTIRTNAATARRRLSSRRSFIYSYALRRSHELRFSGIADDIFSRVREKLDEKIGAVVPQSVQKFSAVYENLKSENSEDWANAVHSCRRILQDLADAVFPAQADRTIDDGGKPKTIRLGPDNYINRIIAFIESKRARRNFTKLWAVILATSETAWIACSRPLKKVRMQQSPVKKRIGMWFTHT